LGETMGFARAQPILRTVVAGWPLVPGHDGFRRNRTRAQTRGAAPRQDGLSPCETHHLAAPPFMIRLLI
jgi:hypothetical protein